TTLYVGTNGSGVFKSTDGGSSWSAMNTGLPGGFPIITALAIAPTTPTTLYAVTAGVFKSTNGGRTWRDLPNAPVGSLVVVSLVIDPITPPTLYADTTLDVFKSTNGGSTWSTILMGLPNAEMFFLVVDSTSPPTLYTGIENYGLFAITFTSPQFPLT